MGADVSYREVGFGGVFGYFRHYVPNGGSGGGFLISTIEWASIPTIAYAEVLYVVLGGSFLAYLCIMTAQKILRPTVVSMYNYMQPIVATIAAIIMGMGSFGSGKEL